MIDSFCGMNFGLPGDCWEKMDEKQASRSVTDDAGGKVDDGCVDGSWYFTCLGSHK